jgi:hypothetical protein
MVPMDRPKVIAFFLGEEIAGDDPHRDVKLRARDIDGAEEVLQQAAKSGTVAARADRLVPAADLTADEAFTAGEVQEMWQRSGLSDDELDSAANAAMVLWTVEQLRQ